MITNDTTVSPAILGLLKCMPPGGRAGFSTWAKADKDRWMAAFKAVLDLEYPEPEHTAGESQP